MGFGCHHRLDGHEFEQTPGAGDGQGSLACHSPWSLKESDTTEQLNNKMKLEQPWSHAEAKADSQVLEQGYQ